MKDLGTIVDLESVKYIAAAEMKKCPAHIGRMKGMTIKVTEIAKVTGVARVVTIVGSRFEKTYHHLR